MTKKSVYPYICPHCKDAPRRGQWRRSWRWKTERGFLNHKCYKDEAPVSPSEKYHLNRENGKSPHWLAGGNEILCPACAGAIAYSGPRNASLRFDCPHCAAALIWQRNGERREKAVIGSPTCAVCGAEMVERQGKHGAFYGCSNYPRCRGKPGARASVVEVVEKTVLCVAVEWDGVTCLDPERVAQLKRWGMREERWEHLKARWWGGRA